MEVVLPFQVFQHIKLLIMVKCLVKGFGLSPVFAKLAVKLLEAMRALS